jgi:diaminohydroxyphosphoribosylaminopyrimidine deaminase/5-amino-6-(5-phosphoribosylamino)uracil reductase
VTLKMATSLDGRVATRSGDSKWISGEQSRALVHRWRAESDAIAVGIGTAIADDPLLTARDVDAFRQPARVVFDSEARLPLESNLVRSAADAPLIVVTGPEADRGRTEALRAAGAEVVAAAGGDRGARIEAALVDLARRGITSLLLEGGPVLASAFEAAGEVDEVRLFVAPLLLGGGRSALEGEGASNIADATRALSAEAETVGDDVLVRARLREW